MAVERSVAFSEETDSTGNGIARTYGPTEVRLCTVEGLTGPPKLNDRNGRADRRRSTLNVSVVPSMPGPALAPGAPEEIETKGPQQEVTTS